MNKMTEKYHDAEAIVTIEGRKYALYKKGSLNKYPHMVDVSTGKVPQGEQRRLLKTYLELCGVNIEPLKEQVTHGYVRQAIKAAQGADSVSTPNNSISMFRNAGTSAKKGYSSITEENIELVHQQAMTSPDYGSNFTLIHDVLKRFPQNVDREVVAMKVALIDLTNSTHINTHIKKIALSEIVELILSIRDFDERVSQGDPLLVSQLAKSNGKINLFSFASKYCTYHNVDVYEQDDYSIFDKVVKNTLPYYIPQLKKTAIEKWRSSYNYSAFNNCIGELLDQCNVHIPFRRRKFDHFLWYSNR